MLTRGGLDIAHVSLRADPIQERCFAGFVAQSCRLERLSRLRDAFIAEKFDVMMRSLDCFQLIAQEPQRLLLLAIKTLLRGADVIAGFANCARVLLWIHTGHWAR